MWILIGLLIMLTGCDPKSSTLYVEAEVDYQGNVPFTLSKPDAIYKLPEDLVEISGLAYLPHGPAGTLVCIQDEEGVAFLFDLKQEEIVRDVKFHRSGDYEGVEVVGDAIYVTKSNGKIYRFILQEKVDKYKSWEFETALNIRNDVEGLAYDAENRLLLIACKDRPDIQENKAHGRAVYAFNLKTEQLEPQPLFTISENDIHQFIIQNKGSVSGDLVFQPSGIAIDPVTGDLVIIASAGNLYVITNRTGDIQDVAILDNKVLRQPEGICFTSDGTLYIASEGRGGKGYICKYIRKTPNADHE